MSVSTLFTNLSDPLSTALAPPKSTRRLACGGAGAADGALCNVSSRGTSAIAAVGDGALSAAGAAARLRGLALVPALRGFWGLPLAAGEGAAVAAEVPVPAGAAADPFLRQRRAGAVAGARAGASSGTGSWAAFFPLAPHFGSCEAAVASSTSGTVTSRVPSPMSWRNVDGGFLAYLRVPGSRSGGAEGAKAAGSSVAAVSSSSSRPKSCSAFFCFFFCL
mmetsp:Transcript_16608/g.64869  ORF Transcript_16608/g.64869 Transcript_16608/m.64869 type:complete len:220 (+) Transcript_16608:2378-3037(+)